MELDAKELNGFLWGKDLAPKTDLKDQAQLEEIEKTAIGFSEM
jgi:hypothetical protein